MFCVSPSPNALKIHFRNVPFCVWILYSKWFLVTIRAKIARPVLRQGRPPTSPILSSYAPDVILDFYYVLLYWSLKVLPPIKEIKETEILDTDR